MKSESMSVFFIIAIFLIFGINSDADGQIMFEDVTEKTGVYYYGDTFGSHWGDFNTDGFPDLWTGNHGKYGHGPKLFLNNGNGTFSDASDLIPRSLIDMDRHGASWGDFDNDGDQDLLVLTGGGLLGENDCWKRDSLGTPSANTGPNTGATRTIWYVFYDSSDDCSPGAQQAFLTGPTIDFNTFNDIKIIFSRHMWDGNVSDGDNMGRLALNLEDSPGSLQFTEVWFQQGTQGNSWDQITVDLSSENNSGQRQIRFVATEGVAGIQSDMAVDEITIQGVAIIPS